jgi:hypothetical protein
VNYEIVELVDFSGREASVYSLIPLGEEETLFERFVGEYEADFRDEIKTFLKLYIKLGTRQVRDILSLNILKGKRAILFVLYTMCRKRICVCIVCGLGWWPLF